MRDGVDTLTSIENLTGSAFGDTLTGDGSANLILGGAGADSLFGGGGADLLEGGEGDDALDGGSGADTASYANAASGVSINLALGSASGGDGADTLTSIENVIGSAWSDVIVGSSAANILAGGGGDDVITGLGGADQLSGGLGADHFVYTALGDSTNGASDTILDFSQADGDIIDLSAIDAINGGADNPFSLVAAFTHSAGQLISTWQVDHWVVQGDTNGDGAADFTLNVFSSAPLAPPDFIL